MRQPENWKKFEQIFNAASVIDDAAAQTKFVADQTVNDSALRAAVLRLLANDRRENCFLDTPIAELGTKILAENADEDLIGRTDFGQYHLIEILGRGGMGIVFLAQDTRLDRKVALKILPSTLNNHQETISRFQQEARAASNVVHQSVAHIYNFGKFEERYFLAMEYVRGRTLRELIRENLIDDELALDFALQIASALQTAHTGGIIHRDIKPENIIVTENNLIKILDFGLAKIETAKNQESLTTSLETTPGLILGTTAYMSPEQVRGAAIDYSSDLWSLGVILYEMIWGKRPFAGETPSDVRASILRDEPPYENISALPEKIFRRILQKEKGERYKNAAELIEDLEKLKANRAKFGFKKVSAIGKSPRPKRLLNAARLPLILGGTLFLIILGGIAFFLLLPRTPNASHVTQINRLTNDGKAKYTTISADGELIAYSIEELGGRAIYLLARNERPNEFERQAKLLIAPTKNIISQLAFSPDKKFLYYKMREPSKSVGSLFRIPTSGAANGEKVLDDLQGAPSFSPDGKQFAFFRLSLNNSHEEVIIADTASGGEERVLYRRSRPNFIPDTAQAVWSPDGRWILISGGTYANDAESYNVYAVQVSDGTAKPVLKDFWGEIWATCWIENGAAFVFAGHQEKLADNNQLWRATFPGGEVTRLTNDYNDYFTAFAAESKDGSRTEIITLNLQRTAQIYQADLNNAAATAIALTAEGDSGYGLSVGADGQIFYGSTKAGNPDIWTMAANGGNPRQLTFNNKLDSQPFVAKNGEFVVFGSYRSGLESLWRMKTDGGEQIMLTPNISRDSLAVAPDSKWIYYRSSAKEAEAVWRISANGGGEPEKFLAGNYKSVAVSPDGKLLAATVQSDDEETNQLGLFAVENPAATHRVFKLAEGAETLEKIRFAPDGKSVVYIVVQKGIGNLWAQAIDGETPAQPLTDFKSLHIYSFDFSADGKQLFCARGELNSHVVRLTLEKPVSRFGW